MEQEEAFFRMLAAEFPGWRVESWSDPDKMLIHVYLVHEVSNRTVEVGRVDPVSLYDMTHLDIDMDGLRAAVNGPRRLATP